MVHTNNPPGFSSYGSLEQSDHPSSNQSSTSSPPAMTPSSSSSHTAEGISMHIHDHDKFMSEETTPSSTPAIPEGPVDEENISHLYSTWKMQTDNENPHHHDNLGNNNNIDTNNNDCQGCTRHPAHYEHLIKSRQYYRDMVLGVNDGLVSTFLLVAGVVGGGMDVKAILLTAVSGAIAGAISMFAGEFVATKSQNEVMTGEINLEHEHVKNYHAEEMKEVSSLLSLIGIGSAHSIPETKSNHIPSSPRCTPTTTTTTTTTTTIAEVRELKKRITQYYGSNPDALLKMMIALELGVIDDEVRSPLIAGATSLSLFFLGALPSTIPFAFVQDPMMGMVVSGLATGVGLLFVGAVKTWATRGNMWFAAMENLLITVAGGGIAYSIGLGFQSLIGEDG